MKLLLGDCKVRLQDIPAASISAILCDPPYGLTGETNGTTATGLMGLAWERDDTYLSKPFWSEILRVLRPEGMVKMFSAPRTYHRLGQMMEAVGLQVSLESWCCSGGMPKSASMSKSIDALTLFGQCNSVTLSKVEKLRPVIGSVRRVTSSKRKAAEGESRSGIKSNMERWLNPVQEDIPVTTGATSEARTWEGWGTGLRPTWEPVLVGRKSR